MKKSIKNTAAERSLGRSLSRGIRAATAVALTSGTVGSAILLATSPASATVNYPSVPTGTNLTVAWMGGNVNHQELRIGLSGGASPATGTVTFTIGDPSNPGDTVAQPLVVVDPHGNILTPTAGVYSYTYQSGENSATFQVYVGSTYDEASANVGILQANARLGVYEGAVKFLTASANTNLQLNLPAPGSTTSASVTQNADGSYTVNTQWSIQPYNDVINPVTGTTDNLSYVYGSNDSATVNVYLVDPATGTRTLLGTSTLANGATSATFDYSAAQIGNGGLIETSVTPTMTEIYNGVVQGEVPSFYISPITAFAGPVSESPSLVSIDKASLTTSSTFTSTGSTTTAVSWAPIDTSATNLAPGQSVEGYLVILKDASNNIVATRFVNASPGQDPYSTSFDTNYGSTYSATVVPYINLSSSTPESDVPGTPQTIDFTSSPTAGLSPDSLSSVVPQKDANGEYTNLAVSAVSPVAPTNGVTFSNFTFELRDAAGNVVATQVVAGPNMKPSTMYSAMFSGLIQGHDYAVVAVTNYNLPSDYTGTVPPNAIQGFNESGPMVTGPNVSNVTGTPELDSSGAGTQALVSWTAPTSQPAGYTLNSYSVSIYQNGMLVSTPMVVGGSQTSTMVSGLTPDTAYEAVVSANYTYGSSSLITLTSAAPQGGDFTTYSSLNAPSLQSNSLSISSISSGGAAPQADVSFGWNLPTNATPTPNVSSTTYSATLVDTTTGTTSTITLPENSGTPTMADFGATMNPISFGDGLSLTLSATYMVGGQSYTVSSTPSVFMAESTNMSLPPVTNLVGLPELGTDGKASAMAIQWTPPATIPPLGYTLAGYTVDVSAVGGDLAFSQNVGPTTTEVTATGLVPNTPYKVKVIANYDFAGQGTLAANTSVTTSITSFEDVDTSISAPTGLVVTPTLDANGAGTSAYASWNAATPPANTNYTVNNYDLKVMDSTGNLVEYVAGVMGTNASIAGLSPNSSYTVQVRADYNTGSGVVSSAWSTPQAVTTLDMLPAPTVSNLSMSAVQLSPGATPTADVSFNWTPGAAPAGLGGATVDKYIVKVDDTTTGQSFVQTVAGGTTGMQGASISGTPTNPISFNDTISITVTQVWSYGGNTYDAASTPVVTTVSQTAPAGLPQPNIDSAVPQIDAADGQVDQMVVRVGALSSAVPLGYTMQGYVVDVYDSTGVLVKSASITSDGSSPVATTFSGLVPGGTYSVNVYAMYYDQTVSGGSPIFVQAPNSPTVTESVMTSLEAPSNVAASAMYDGNGQGSEASVSWTGVQASGGYVPVSYNISVTPSSGGASAYYLNVPSIDLSTTLTGLMSDTQYTISVQANYQYGNSVGTVAGQWSAPTQVTTYSDLPAPLAPTLSFTTPNGSNHIEGDVHWNAVNTSALANVPGGTTVSYKVIAQDQNGTSTDGETLTTSGGMSGESYSTPFGYPVVSMQNGDIVTSEIVATYTLANGSTVTLTSPVTTDSINATALNLPPVQALQVASALDSSGNATLANANFEVPVGAATAGWTITGYKVTAVPNNGMSPVFGSFDLSSTTTSGNVTSYSCTPNVGCNFTMSGLTSGVGYTMYVQPIYANGTETYYGASASNTFTESAFAPSSPTIISAIPGDSSIALAWTPGADGGSPITSYTIVATPNQVTATDKVVTFKGVNPADTSYDLTGLVNGVTYTVTLVENNVIGASSPATATVTLPGGAPGTLTPYAPPTIPVGDTVTPTPGDGQVGLSWLPVTEGDTSSPIAGYTVSYGPTAVGITNTVTVPATEAAINPINTTITGLTNGTEYSFIVHAYAGAIGDTNAEVSFPQVEATPVAPAPSIAPSIAPAINAGYHLVGSDGGVFSFDAPFGGSLGNITLNKPIVGGALDYNKLGAYWLVAADGGVFALGGAPFEGSAAEQTGTIAKFPVVGMAATSDGGGYVLVDSHGNTYSFGDAPALGGVGNLNLNAPIVGIAMTPDNGGYWLFAADGGVFAFGDAAYYGSMGGVKLNQPIVGGVATPDGHGYYLVAADGGIFTFGDAQFQGSTGGMVLNQPIVGMKLTTDGGGYWLFAKDGGVFTFGDANYDGSATNLRLNGPIVGGF